MIEQIGAGILRVLHIISESKDPEDAEQKEWEGRDGEIDPNTDPSLWEGTDDNFEFDDEDWEALGLAINGDTKSLNRAEVAFLTDAGMLKDNKVTVFGREWHKEMGRKRKGELPKIIVE